MTTKLNLALLLCDTPAPQVVQNFGAYNKLFPEIFDKACPDNVEISWQSFDVVHRQEYPSFEDIQAKKYDGIVITGSVRSAYEQEEWILKLIEYVKDIRSKAPETRIVGVCFGHQIVAMACGGTCVSNPKGWEFGYTATKLTTEGQRYLNTDKAYMAIQEVHKDHVPDVPEGFICLASTAPHTPVQLMVSKDNRVISVQGHPEFPPELVGILLNVRLGKGILDNDFVQEAMTKLFTDPLDNVWLVEHFIQFLLGKTPNPQDM